MSRERELRNRKTRYLPRRSTAAISSPWSSAATTSGSSGRVRRASRIETRSRRRPSSRGASRARRLPDRAGLALDYRLARDAALRRLPAEPGVHGGSHVGELAFVDLPGRVLALDVGEEQRVLARVVGPGRGGIAAVVGGEDEQVVGAKRLEQVREPPVEILQAAVEVDRVVAVSPEHVGLDQVREDEALVEFPEQAFDLRDSLQVGLGGMGFVDVAAGEDLAHLADRVDAASGVADQAEVVGSPRLERVVMAPVGALVITRLARKGTRDDPSDGVLSGEDLAGDPAGVVELLRRDSLLVRRELEDGVRRGVDDPLSRLLVLLAELLDDLGPRRGPVAENAAAGAMHERIDHVVRKAVRIGRKRLRSHDSHQLPMARRRVLSLRAFDQAAGRRRCPRLGGTALERLDVSEP